MKMVNFRLFPIPAFPRPAEPPRQPPDQPKLRCPPLPPPPLQPASCAHLPCLGGKTKGLVHIRLGLLITLHLWWLGSDRTMPSGTPGLLHVPPRVVCVGGNDLRECITCAILVLDSSYFQ